MQHVLIFYFLYNKCYNSLNILQFLVHFINFILIFIFIKKVMNQDFKSTDIEIGVINS
jgi:hypothetical protein